MSANFTDTLYYMLNLRDREREANQQQAAQINADAYRNIGMAQQAGDQERALNTQRAQEQGQVGTAPNYQDPELKAAADIGAAATRNAMAAEQRKNQEQQLIEGMRQSGETGRTQISAAATDRWRTAEIERQRRNDWLDYLAQQERNKLYGEKTTATSNMDASKSLRVALQPLIDRAKQFKLNRRLVASKQYTPGGTQKVVEAPLSPEEIGTQQQIDEIIQRLVGANPALAQAIRQSVQSEIDTPPIDANAVPQPPDWMSPQAPPAGPQSTLGRSVADDLKARLGIK